MKIKTAPTLIAILVFLVISVFYSTYEAASDGWSKIGFPFPFYIYTSGKVGDFGGDDLINIGFTFSYFIIDLLILGIFVLVFNYLAVRLSWLKK